MPFVEEGATDRAGAGVEIFVGAPNGEIDLPIVQRDRHVANGVGKVDTDRYPALLRHFGNG